MRVLGVDCGTEYTGFGVVELGHDDTLVCLTCGAIKLSPREPLARRLSRIYDGLGELITEHHPDEVAIEGIFYALNHPFFFFKGQLPLDDYLGLARRLFPAFEVRNGTMLAAHNELAEAIVRQWSVSSPIPIHKPAAPRSQCGQARPPQSTSVSSPSCTPFALRSL